MKIYDHSCTLCPLHEFASHVCMEASGRPTWPGVIVGEAPGAQEDDVGRPFVGRSGRILDRALNQATGLPAQIARKKLVVTNAAKCRPPANRTPTKPEMHACFPYLVAEIQQHKPKAILCLGNAAAWQVLGLEGVFSLRDQEYYFDTEARVFVTFHPAYVLRQGLDSDAAKMFFENVASFISYLGVAK